MSMPSGAGLGFRRALVGAFDEADLSTVGFMELAPENWIGVGGALKKQLRRYTERFPFVCHGLSLSLGSPSPLDEELVRAVGRFLDEHQISLYSEHLSYCSDEGHLYDLLPIPFTAEAVRYVAARIRRVQDILGRRIAVENVSYYASLGGELSEADFVKAVLQEADCELLLDVNNVYVNSVNHRYDPREFIAAMPGERLAYYHIAGHYDEAPDLLVDTHGSAVKREVWGLLDYAYGRFGTRPTLLERDFNFPPMSELLAEIGEIRALQTRHAPREACHAS
ncbi:MAG: DUF692 domain-containing protein [Gammaproteobacteria bacterium]|nr:DUF692 domain-containing protein [Gammaproteobacteria bacterium]